MHTAIHYRKRILKWLRKMDLLKVIFVKGEFSCHTALSGPGITEIKEINNKIFYLLFLTALLTLILTEVYNRINIVF